MRTESLKSSICHATDEEVKTAEQHLVDHDIELNFPTPATVCIRVCCEYDPRKYPAIMGLINWMRMLAAVSFEGVEKFIVSLWYLTPAGGHNAFMITRDQLLDPGNFVSEDTPNLLGESQCASLDDLPDSAKGAVCTTMNIVTAMLKAPQRFPRPQPVVYRIALFTACADNVNVVVIANREAKTRFLHPVFMPAASHTQSTQIAIDELLESVVSSEWRSHFKEPLVSPGQANLMQCSSFSSVDPLGFGYSSFWQIDLVVYVDKMDIKKRIPCPNKKLYCFCSAQKIPEDERYNWKRWEQIALEIQTNSRANESQ
jgi:hypothetical protein